MDQLLCPEIVGRDAELRAVLDTVRAAARGVGESTVLVGEAGAGKSRLLVEARARAHELGVTVLHGRVPAGGTSPFGPFTEAVAGAFRAGLPTDPSLHPVRAQLARLAGEEPVNRPGDRAIEPQAPPVLAEALLRLLHVAARDGGALLLVEDLHWADADTLVVLDYLLVNAADHGASCVLTLRPDPRCAAFRTVHRLADVRAARLVELRPLPDDDVDRMVRLCLRTEAVPAGMLDFVRERADGVPFFVEELLAGLLRSGALVRADGGWQVIERRLPRIGACTRRARPHRRGPHRLGEHGHAGAGRRGLPRHRAGTPAGRGIRRRLRPDGTGAATRPAPVQPERERPEGSGPPGGPSTSRYRRVDTVTRTMCGGTARLSGRRPERVVSGKGRSRCTT